MVEVIGYHSEWITYPEYQFAVSNKEAILITKKLLKHFKLPKCKITFTKHNAGGTAYNWGHRINYGNNKCNMGVICHEVNHFLCWKVYGTTNDKARHGTKKWCRQLNKIFRYVRKRNYWMTKQAIALKYALTIR